MVCRRRYAYDYMLELEPSYYKDDRPVSLASVGTAVHAGLEALYRGEDAGRALEASITEQGMRDATVKIQKSLVNAGDVARGCLNRYVSWKAHTDFDSGRKTVMLEERLRMEIIPGVEITGMADRVVEDEWGQLHVYDYKTCGQYNQYTAFSDRNRQGLTYAALVEAHTGMKVVSFTLLQIHRSPPKANPLPVNPLTDYFTDEQKSAHIRHLKNVAGEIQALHGRELAVYPHPGQHCDWCPFKELCYTADAEPESFDEMINTKFRKKTP